MNNLSSGLVDAKIRACDKDLPVIYVGTFSRIAFWEAKTRSDFKFS